jgi:hypothetical protein
LGTAKPIESTKNREPVGERQTQRFIVLRYHTTEANLHNWLKRMG